MLQRVAVCCSECVEVCCSVLQCVAVWCSVLQGVAVHCNVLQCAAVCCNVLQCIDQNFDGVLLQIVGEHYIDDLWVGCQKTQYESKDVRRYNT